ncbi:MAG: phosphonate ABC transporter, permease protein PhnE [Acidimicrobiaceae bacterium]|nr:phosphonate ABC transporter, permease protein PhnE [Acidimicrobiaceae bacterium]
MAVDTTSRPVAPVPVAPPRSSRQRAMRLVLLVAAAAVLGQAYHSTHARPQELVSGSKGMADILSRSFPPEPRVLHTGFNAIVQTFDIALLGTVFAVVLAFPIAVLAAENLSPLRPLYYAARGVIALCRVVPDLIWALFFVTAVGLGPFPGVLAITVHSVGMLGRLWAETFEEMDAGPLEALTVVGANRPQVVANAVVPGALPTMIGIALYRLDENVRSSLVLGFVGAGGIGFQIFDAMQLFRYREVLTYIILTFVLVFVVERCSALLRRKIH